MYNIPYFRVQYSYSLLQYYTLKSIWLVKYFSTVFRSYYIQISLNYTLNFKYYSYLWVYLSAESGREERIKFDDAFPTTTRYLCNNLELSNNTWNRNCMVPVIVLLVHFVECGYFHSYRNNHFPTLNFVRYYFCTWYPRSDIIAAFRDFGYLFQGPVFPSFFFDRDQSSDQDRN
jgi:hypothetical protein